MPVDFRSFKHDYHFFSPGTAGEADGTEELASMEGAGTSGKEAEASTSTKGA